MRSSELQMSCGIKWNSEQSPCQELNPGQIIFIQSFTDCLTSAHKQISQFWDWRVLRFLATAVSRTKESWNVNFLFQSKLWNLKLLSSLQKVSRRGSETVKTTAKQFCTDKPEVSAAAPIYRTSGNTNTFRHKAEAYSLIPGFIYFFSPHKHFSLDIKIHEYLFWKYKSSWEFLQHTPLPWPDTRHKAQSVSQIISLLISWALSRKWHSSRTKPWSIMPINFFNLWICLKIKSLNYTFFGKFFKISCVPKVFTNHNSGTVGSSEFFSILILISAFQNIAHLYFCKRLSLLYLCHMCGSLHVLSFNSLFFVTQSQTKSG